MRLVPNTVISSRGVAGLWRAEQGTLETEGAGGEEQWGEDIKCLVRDVCADSSSTLFWHSLKSILPSLVIKAFGTPSPTLTTSTKFSGEKVMREQKQLYNQKGSATGQVEDAFVESINRSRFISSFFFPFSFFLSFFFFFLKSVRLH